MPDPHMPDAATLERLRTETPDGPIVMLNLLKYREPDGREAFARYGAVTTGLIQKHEGELIFGGKAGPALCGTDVDWDDVLIVRFPSVEHFLAMIEGDTYRNEAVPHRAEALEATIWLAMVPMAGFEG
jgi:uncharacterized protein (DUF1330 family)